RRRDTLVLGSDGLFDNLHLEEITEYVRKGPLARAAESLAAACRRRMCEPRADHPSKPDDLTFLLYRRRE
ncbi:MAG: PP2C family protein-serine/threonine phosphatase, partial [Planctomycetota bacterium]